MGVLSLNLRNDTPSSEVSLVVGDLGGKDGGGGDDGGEDVMFVAVFSCCLDMLTFTFIKINL